MARNPYVRLTVTEDAIRTVGGTVVGCWKSGDAWQLLIERPVRTRAKAAGTRKPRTNAKAAPAPQPASSFPGSVAANG